MEKVRYGIVGLGNQGSQYTAHFVNGRIENGVITKMNKFYTP